MTTITFDTLEFANQLKDAGIKEKEAEAIVNVVRKMQSSASTELSTKQDITEIKIEMANIKIEMAMNKAEMIKWVVSVGVLQMALITALMIKLTG